MVRFLSGELNEDCEIGDDSIVIDECIRKIPLFIWHNNLTNMFSTEEIIFNYKFR